MNNTEKSLKERKLVINALLKEWRSYLTDKSVLYRKVNDNEVAIYCVDHFFFWLMDKYKFKKKKDMHMKNDIKITKMIDGTYKAWTKRKRTEVNEFNMVVDADGKNPIEAENNLKSKLVKQAEKETRKNFEEF